MIKTFKTPAIPNVLFRETFDELEKFFNLENYKNYNSSISKTNFYEDENNYKLEVLIPGVKKENINILVEGQKLKVEIDVNNEKKSEDNNYILKEFKIDSFKKIYPLPKNSDLEKISSKYVDGILYICVPKKEPKDNKKIKVHID